MKPQHLTVADLADRPPTRPGRVRLRGACVLAPCLAVLGTAVCLRPSAAGYGTHTQMRMPPCSFLSRTGLPCPTCGMTTSVTSMAHGRFGAAFRAHPFGVVLFCAFVAAVCVGGMELVSGRDVFARLRPGLWWVVLGVGAMFAGWGWNLLVGLQTGRLPMR